jgi:hypothetical protein
VGVARTRRAVVIEQRREREKNDSYVQEDALMSCHCEQSGLSGLYGLDGLLGALVVSGSRVRAGFEYQSNASIAEHNAGEDTAATIQEVLSGAMLGSGVFRDAFVQVNEPAWMGLQHGYITASGTTYQDVNDPYEISNLIAGLIQSYLPVLTVTRRDPVAIDYVPPEAARRSGVQQVYDPSRQQQNQNQFGQPSKCDWDKLSIGDYVACQLGITPTAGIAAGAVGTLVLVGGVLALLVFLKR